MNELFAEIKNILSTGFSAGKWQVQLLKLNSDAARIEKQRTRLVENLGILAWEKRVSHPAYQGEFSAIEEVEQERVQLAAEIQNIQDQIQKATRELGQIRADYTGQIGVINQKKQSAASQASQVRTTLRAVEERFTLAQKQYRKTAADITLLRTQLDQVTDSTLPDKEDRVSSINNAIHNSQALMAEASKQLNDAGIESETLKTQLETLTVQISDLEQQIAGLQADQRAVTQPLESQVTSCQTNLKLANEKHKEYVQEIQLMGVELGPAVEQARPSAAAMENAYAQIDFCKGELKRISGESEVLKARLASRDVDTMHKFYWIISATIGGLILLVAVVMGGYYLLNNVVFPISRIAGASTIGDVKLIYSWANRECITNDKFAVINIWQNTSNKPYQVYFENSLIGANRAVLNKTVSTAHFGPNTSILDFFEMDRKGSTVKDYRLTAIKADTPADEKTITDGSKVVVNPTVVLGEENMVSFGVKVANKSDFTLESVSVKGVLLDEKETPVTILEADYGKLIPVDQEVTISLKPINAAGAYSCIPTETFNFARLDAPVSVWYFVTYSLGSQTYGYFSDKASFKP